MIYKALELIRNDLSNYLKAEAALDINNDAVLLGNIAFLEADFKGAPDDNLLENVVITLVKVSQERTLRNLPHYEIINQKTVYKNPPVNLNLFLLITVGTSKKNDYFKNLLIYLSHIIKFFQGKNVFTNKDTLVPIENITDTENELEEFQLIVDLYSPSFEEANYMWSTMGGRQLPYVCYKARLVELARDTKQEERGIVKEVVLES